VRVRVGPGRASILKASPSPWDFGNSDVHFGGGADSDDGVLDVPITGTGMTGTLTANPSPVIFSTQPYFCRQPRRHADGHQPRDRRDCGG
jgi:hypothetical protein